MGYEIWTTYRHQNEPVQNLELFKRAWNECIELQSQSKDMWINSALIMLQGIPRYEVALVSPDRNIVGGAIVAKDAWDVHVGPCMSVFTQYILPEHRNRGACLHIMREALHLTKVSGEGVLAYTHRTADWCYKTTYRRIK